MSKCIQIKRGKDRINIFSNGGMVTGEFEVDGQMINPFYSHPWHEDEVKQGLLKFLKGDFVCVPFGITPENPVEGYLTDKPTKKEYAHGLSSNGTWEIDEQSDDKVDMHLDYSDGKIDKITRKVAFLVDKQGIEFKNRVKVNCDIEIPIGIHPIFRLNEKPGSMRLILPKGKFVATYPRKPEPDSRFKPNQFLEDITNIPLINGGYVDASRLPLGYDTEELIMLCGLEEGKVILENPEAGYRVILEFDVHCFKNCMLWISNKGRDYSPWNSRNLCLGIEPVTAAFDFGENISTSHNLLNEKGIKTCVKMKREEEYTIDYKIYIEDI